ncbi:hypothetical protein [Vibrio parahaemolyticus]|uniref:hypothetical protein n=1 Tax=Vibrio parahaemolyticus TaxID=670 RepID=UPI00111CA946|nr:hypothetical protein [Vibrio parahaemolyticus]TOG00647.1 hypothetical protein CGJ11_22495 [Vibrio parahaemolyticus]
MSAEEVSYWSMLGTWLAAISTTAAVLVALFLPSIQKYRHDQELNSNSRKLLRAQLVNINENVVTHKQAADKGIIVENPVVSFNYLPHEILSVLSPAELVTIYKLKSDLELTEQLRSKALQASKVNPSGSDTSVLGTSYKECINNLVIKSNEVLAAWADLS